MHEFVTRNRVSVAQRMQESMHVWMVIAKQCCDKMRNKDVVQRLSSRLKNVKIQSLSGANEVGGEGLVRQADAM